MYAARMIRLAVCGSLLLAITAATVAAADDFRLIEAVKHRDSKAVRSLMTQPGVDVNTRQGDGATALHWAAHWDDVETAALLVKAGANPNLANDLGVTPLALAAANGNSRMAEVLLNARANPNALQTNGRTPLLAAAWTGNADVVKLMLEHGGNPNTIGPAGQTPLMWAISEKHPDAARLLIQAGADVRARSAAGFTPLLFAARMGDLESARLLVAAGVDPNEMSGAPKDETPAAPNGAGATPAMRRASTDGARALMVSTIRGNVEVTKFLLDSGADPNTGETGYTPLHWAAGIWDNRFGEYGANIGLEGEPKLEMVRALLAKGASINARITKPPFGALYGREAGDTIINATLVGATPFALAAKAGELAVMRVLLEAGADPNIRTAENATPLMLASGFARDPNWNAAIENRSLEVVKALVALGADVNAVDGGGNTALHGAAHMRYETIIQYLVDQGARLDVSNKEGHTPLFIAERHLVQASVPVTGEHTSAGDLLRKLGAR